ncbi:MAG: c-type cytochrome [Vicinamibacterales bacterium]
MRRFSLLAILGLVPLASAVLLAQQGAAPAGAPAVSLPPPGLSWAYGIAPDAPLPGAARAGGAGGGARAGGAPAPAPDPTPLSVPGSTLTFTRAQIPGGNGAGPADWFPGDHPTMPDVVARGRGTDVRACSLCHYPNGKGRPENAGVAGLPVSYFIQTLHDFRNDLRKSGEPRKGNTNVMATIAKGMTEEEIRQSAEYFASMKWTPWIKVVETQTVAKTRVAGGMYLRLEGNETEPIGMRIIETPEFTERTEVLRDPRASFIAFVPTGSVKKGETLVTTGGNGRTVACGSCHGADLQGMGPVPGLAGRSPSYIARQMYDIKSGARKGEWAALMKPVVDKLTDEDYVSISAYIASRPAATR